MSGFLCRHGAWLLLKRKLKTFAVVPPFSTSSPQPHYAGHRFGYSQLTNPAKEDSFAVSYLIENYGFLPERAIAAAKRLRFGDPQKPHSCFAFFRSYGFSVPQICSIFRRVPRLIVFDSIKNILPKLEFLESRGLSRSEIVSIVSSAPNFLERNLVNFIAPSFDLVLDFCDSDQNKALEIVKLSAFFVFTSQLWKNVHFLMSIGVSKSTVLLLLRLRPLLLCRKSSNFEEAVELIKELGFETSKRSFILALISKFGMSKPKWDRKVAILKNWGWSEELFFDVFRANPQFMRNSEKKIEAVLDYWVNQLGWDALILAKGSAVIGCSLQKRIKPRAAVLRHLLSKGLMDKNTGLMRPFLVSEQLFLQRYVKCHEQESPQLLKLYEKDLSISH